MLDHPAGGSRKRPSDHSKSALASEISNFLFGYLGGFKIPTNLLEKISDTEVHTRQLTMIPLEVMVHNIATGDYAKRFGLKEGVELTFPVIEHRYKRADLGKPLLNEFHVYSLGIATPEQLRIINRLASKTNVVLRSFFERRELRLDTLGMEFGLFENQIMIGNEISPRTCTFTDLRKNGKGGRGRAAAGARRHDIWKSPDIGTYIEIRNRIYRTL
jgi:phosphoribosylaminoimidazole-succinocarboxamide synthase